jgi:hypothetical protein
MVIRCDDSFELMFYIQMPFVVMKALELCAAGTEEVGRVLSDDVVVVAER